VISHPAITPLSLKLEQNYPNPFNTTTTINYQLSNSAIVNISIYNVRGQLIETLVDGRKDIGFHSVMWNAKGIGPGLYFYQIKAGEITEVKKCLLLK
jgi:flagellar hook assembly protein FlgD